MTAGHGFSSWMIFLVDPGDGEHSKQCKVILWLWPNIIMFQSSTNLSEVAMVLANYFVFIINNIVNLAKLIRKTDTIVNQE